MNNSKNGTGLGLSFTKALVELHDGKIFIESFRGTKVVIKLKIENENLKINFPSKPSSNEKTLLAKSPEIPKVINASETGNNKKKEHHVLIIEDNVELRSYIKKILDSQYHIHTCSNGAEGFEYLKVCTNEPDVVISDVVMPEMSGIEFCNAIKSNIESSHIPIILLTAKDKEEDIVKGIENGAEVYLSKPFSVSVLKAHLASLISNRKKLQDYFSSKPFFDVSKISTNDMDSKLIHQLVQIIEDNIENIDLSVVKLAEQLNMSQYTLYKKVKAVSGQSPNDYIKTIKLRHAIELLRNKDLTLNDVSMKAGFASLSYFSSAFKKQFGTAPSVFRKTLLK
jgi:YesN/AraC family two-component response regulator